MTTLNVNVNWKLKSLQINFMEYGDYKGKYVGKISFENNQSESFVFNMTPVDMQPYLSLIAANVVDSANLLGKKLMQSLNILELPSNEIT